MATHGLLEQWPKRIRRPSLSALAIVEKSSPAQSHPQGLRSKQTDDRSCPLLSLVTHMRAAKDPGRVPTRSSHPSSSCPRLSRASTSFLLHLRKQGVDGRDKPGHDSGCG